MKLLNNLFCLQKRGFCLLKSWKESRTYSAWYFCSVPHIIVQHITAKISGCKQWSTSPREVYAQETHEHLQLFGPAGGGGGAERQQLSGPGRVLLGLQSPAWRGQRATVECKVNSILTLNLIIILTLSLIIILSLAGCWSGKEQSNSKRKLNNVVAKSVSVLNGHF